MYQQCKDSIPRLFKLAHNGVESAREIKLRIESLIKRVEVNSKGTVNLLEDEPVTTITPLIDPFDHSLEGDSASYGMNHMDSISFVDQSLLNSEVLVDTIAVGHKTILRVCNLTNEPLCQVSLRSASKHLTSYDTIQPGKTTDYLTNDPLLILTLEYKLKGGVSRVHNCSAFLR